MVMVQSMLMLIAMAVMEVATMATRSRHRLYSIRCHYHVHYCKVQLFGSWYWVFYYTRCCRWA